jgi:cell division protein FtsB
VRVRILIPRRKPKKLVARSARRSGRLALIIAIVALIGTLYALLGDSGLMAVMSMRARATQLHHEIAAQERANQELLDLIRPLRAEDPDAIERLAREELFMARPGDTVYVLPPVPSASPLTPTPGDQPTTPTAPSLRRR